MLVNANVTVAFRRLLGEFIGILQGTITLAFNALHWYQLRLRNYLDLPDNLDDQLAGRKANL